MEPDALISSEETPGIAKTIENVGNKIEDKLNELGRSSAVQKLVAEAPKIISKFIR